MVSLTRPEGPAPDDLNLSRRGLAGLFFGGYAVAALSAHAEPIVTDAGGLVVEDALITTADSEMPAYVARPAAPGRRPVILVVSEVFGVHQYIRDVCRRLAKQGYFAVAPAFFHRAGDPAPLTDFAEVRKIVATVTDAQITGDITATLNWLRTHAGADAGKVGITGFCWGGAVVWTACARFKEFDAGVAWYGRLAPPAPGEFLGEPGRQWPHQVAHALNCPVLGLYAEKDRGIPVPTVERMRQLLKTYRKRGSDIILYPDAQHGFHADYRETYQAAAAQDGWRRMLEHFRRNGLRARAVETSRRAA